MHTRMDLDLLNYVSPDLKWNSVKKGRRSMTRRPRKPGADGSELGNTVAGFEAKKSGSDGIGGHFAEKMVDAPLKKRRLLLQSQSPSPPQTPCLNGEGDQSPEPQTSSIHHEDYHQQFCSNSPSLSQKAKSKTGSRSSHMLNVTKKEVSDLVDFSGIELLAAAACSGLIDDEDHFEDFSMLKKHSPKGVDSCTVDIKEAITSTKTDGSSIHDAMAPDKQTSHDNGKDEGEKKVDPSKGLRLHWDLNTVMDEWEEPSNSLPVEPSEGENPNLKGYESKCVEVEHHSHQSSEEHDAAVSVAPVCENSNDDSCGKTCELVDDMVFLPELMDTKVTSKTSDGESSASKSDVVDSLIHPDKCEDFSTTTSFLREQTIVKEESDDHLVHPNHKNDMSISDRQPVPEQVVQGGCPSPNLCKSYCDNKVTSEDPLSECCGSDVTQDENSHDAVNKVQIGYDSPFEDGELREPIEWEETEVVEKESLYYMSDNLHKNDFGTIENSLPEKIGVSRDHGQAIEDQNLSVKEATHNHEIEPSKRPHCLLGRKASMCEPNLAESDCGSGKDPSRRKTGNLMHVDESTSFEACRNGGYARQSRSSNYGDSYSRSGRALGPEKFTGRDCFRNDQSSPYDDSSMRVWGLKNSHECHRPKIVAGDPVARSRNYNPRSQNRRPSPSERNNSYGFSRRSPVRSLSRDRYRGGAGFHSQVLRRAPEEEYHDAKPCYLDRIPRCYSPNFIRPVRRSRSRSRSGSPIAWHFQKRRNLDTQQSPDHEARFLADKGPRNTGDIEAGFDGQRVMDGQFRDKRQSEVAVIRRNQRFESIGYPERLKSDGFRFTQRSERFSQPSGPVREQKYHDATRKPDDRYGKGNRVGRSDDGGAARRFRYAVDDSFESRNRRTLDGFSRDGRYEHSCFKEATRMVLPESKSDEKGAGAARFPHI